MVDHSAFVEAVAQHVPYAGLSEGPPPDGPEPLGIEAVRHITVGIVTGGLVPEEGKEDWHHNEVGDLPFPFSAGQYIALVTQRRWTHRQPIDLFHLYARHPFQCGR